MSLSNRKQNTFEKKTREVRMNPFETFASSKRE